MFGRETELGGRWGCQWAQGCPRSPSVPRGWGPPRMALIPRDSGTGMVGKWWLAEGAIHPLRPLRGEPVIHPGSQGWERPPSSAKTRCTHGVVPQWEKREGTSGVFLGAVPQKAQGWLLDRRRVPQTPELGRWVTLMLVLGISGWCHQGGGFEGLSPQSAGLQLLPPPRPCHGSC